MNAESLTGMAEHLNGDAQLLEEWANTMNKASDSASAGDVYRSAFQLRRAADTLTKLAGRAMLENAAARRTEEKRLALGLDEIRER